MNSTLCTHLNSRSGCALSVTGCLSSSQADKTKSLNLLYRPVLAGSFVIKQSGSSALLRCAAPRRDLRSLTAALRPSADVAALLRTRTPAGLPPAENSQRDPMKFPRPVGNSQRDFHPLGISRGVGLPSVAPGGPLKIQVLHQSALLTSAVMRLSGGQGKAGLVLTSPP